MGGDGVGGGRMTLQAFAAALESGGVRLPDTRGVFAAMPQHASKRRYSPQCMVNGEIVPVKAVPGGQEGVGGAEDGSVREWRYTHEGAVTVTNLEVGLRSGLRKSVQDQGCSVIVQVLDAGVVKESACLNGANSYSSRWPDLADNPVTFQVDSRNQTLNTTP